jgi:hypothetical protein
MHPNQVANNRNYRLRQRQKIAELEERLLIFVDRLASAEHLLDMEILRGEVGKEVGERLRAKIRAVIDYGDSQ